MLSHVALICDLFLEDTATLHPNWAPGPFAETYDFKGRTITTDAATRATNFPQLLAQQLFGPTVQPQPEQQHSDEVRFHWTGVLVPPENWISEVCAGASVDPNNVTLTLTRAELLRADNSYAVPHKSIDGTENHASAAVLALHIAAETREFNELVRIVQYLAHDRGPLSSSLRGSHALSLIGEMPDLAEGLLLTHSATDKLRGEGCVYSAVLSSRMDVGTVDDPQVANDEELYALAALHELGRSHTANARREEAVSQGLRLLSRDWSLLTLRHGCAFQLHNGWQSDFAPFAMIYFRTLYVDAIMLGRLQDHILRSWEWQAWLAIEESNRRSEDGQNTTLEHSSQTLRSLNRSLTVDGMRYWMHSTVSNTGSSMGILTDLHRAQGFQERIEVVNLQVENLEQLADRDARDRSATSQERLATIVVVVSATLFPLTAADEIRSILSAPEAPWVVLSISAAAGFGAWLVRRLVLRAPKRPRQH